MKQKVPVDGTRPSVWPVALIVVVALAVRLLHVHATREVPLLRHLVGDAAAYVRWAGEVAAGDWIGQTAFYQAPLYPYFLAVWFKLGGAEVWLIRVVQCVLGAGAVWCLYRGTVAVFGRAVALVASMMLGVYAPAIFFDGIVQKASLGCFLVCALLATMAGGFGRRSFGGAAGMGVVLGLLVLTRENALVWVAIFPVWIALSWRGLPLRGTLGALGGFFAGLGLVLLPVSARNVAVSGEWSVSTFQAGPNFYIGNHRGADGRYRPLVRGHETPSFERRDAILLAERDLGRALSAREVSRYWMTRALRDIRDDPGEWLGLMGRKMLMVWNRVEIPDAEGQCVYAEASVLLAALESVWHFGALVPLAAIGVVSRWRQWRRLWVYYALIVSMALAVVLFYVMARYRFPLVPLLIPFAAVGVVDLWRCIEPRAWRKSTKPAQSHEAVLSSSSKCDAVSPVAGDRSSGSNDQVAYRDLNERAQQCATSGAVRAGFGHVAPRGLKPAAQGERAVARRPLVTCLVVGVVVAVLVNWRILDEDRLNAMSWMNVGVALAQQGDVKGATPYFQRAVSGHPESAEANGNFAQALAIGGDYAGAIPHYQRALASEFALPGVEYNLAVALERVGRSEEALTHYERAWRLDSTDTDARNAVTRLRHRGK